jgi:hypothetical protein
VAGGAELAAEEKTMMQILAIEIAALLFAAIANGIADSLYFGGRLAPRVHALWVSLSTAGMGTPLLTWVVQIYVGPGALATGLVAALVSVMFIMLYRQLRITPATRGAGRHPAPAAAEKAQPPASG